MLEEKRNDSPKKISINIDPKLMESAKPIFKKETPLKKDIKRDAELSFPALLLPPD